MSGAPHPIGPEIGHEERDVNLRPIIVAAVGLVLALVFVALAMLGLYDVFARREARLSPPENPLAAAEAPRLPPEPRLQVQPIRDLRELHAAERKLLDHYAWVDRSAGIVRIPIERAMEVMVERSGEGTTK
jgi:hypothetical protein